LKPQVKGGAAKGYGEEEEESVKPKLFSVCKVRRGGQVVMEGKMLWSFFAKGGRESPLKEVDETSVYNDSLVVVGLPLPSVCQVRFVVIVKSRMSLNVVLDGAGAGAVLVVPSCVTSAKCDLED
jgi:hypothetical protein